MTKRKVTVEIDLDFIVTEINANVGEDVETTETVGLWLDQNEGTVRQEVQDAVAAAIGEAYA